MSQEKAWHPYVSRFDPCPPITVKTFMTPPNLYIQFQPMNLPQFPPLQALRMGTLWPALYSPYAPKP
jgi:spore coat protein JA